MSKAISIPRNKPGRVVEPFQHPAPKLVMAPPDMRPWKMTPPSLSPLHMSPPNMELPNFSPIQDHMPLPTLSASTFIPPQSFLTHETNEPISVVRYSRVDPTLLAVGTCAQDPEEAQPVGQPGKVIIFKVADVEREVRGDREIIARGVYEVRKKVRPQLQEMASADAPSGVLDLVFSPHDPQLLIATLATGSVIAYRVRIGRYSLDYLSTHQLAQQTPIFSFVFSPTSPTLAVATTGSGSVVFLEIPGTPRKDNTIKPVQTIQAHSAQCMRAVFSWDGKRVYTVGEDGQMISWTAKANNPKQRWSDDSAHSKGITAVLPWPAPGAADVNKKRRLLLTGSYDGMFRVFDMSMQNRPPHCRQEMDLHGAVWRLAPFPPLPVYDEIKSLGAGVFSAESNPDVELDPEQVGILASATKGAARVLIHKQKFEEVFLPRRDGSDIVDWTTNDGVKMDHEGREKQYYWYDLADIEEHEGSEVYAGDAVSIIDYDPLFKDAGEQRLRRGWRIVSASRDGRMCFWQVYIE